MFAFCTKKIGKGINIFIHYDLGILWLHTLTFVCNVVWMNDAADADAGYWLKGKIISFIYCLSVNLLFPIYLTVSVKMQSTVFHKVSLQSIKKTMTSNNILEWWFISDNDKT